MTYLKAFVAGFVATLVFHQGLLALLHAAGASPMKAFSMAPTGPLHVPQVISLAFWGGVWGILLWLAIARLAGPAYWLASPPIGPVAPGVVAPFVVLPLPRETVHGGSDKKVLVGR